LTDVGAQGEQGGWSDVIGTATVEESLKIYERRSESSRIRDKDCIINHESIRWRRTRRTRRMMSVVVLNAAANEEVELFNSMVVMTKGVGWYEVLLLDYCIMYVV